jgi:hypothetical protein
MAIPLHALGKATGIYAGDESSQKLWHLAIMPIGQAWECDSSRSLQTGNRDFATIARLFQVRTRVYFLVGIASKTRPP